MLVTNQSTDWININECIWLMNMMRLLLLSFTVEWIAEIKSINNQSLWRVHWSIERQWWTHWSVKWSGCIDIEIFYQHQASNDIMSTYHVQQPPAALALSFSSCVCHQSCSSTCHSTITSAIPMRHLAVAALATSYMAIKQIVHFLLIFLHAIKRFLMLFYLSTSTLAPQAPQRNCHSNDPSIKHSITQSINQQ